MSQKESPSDKQDRRSQIPTVVILVMFALVLYPLSLGPIHYLLFRNALDPRTHDIVHTVYTPLIPWWIDDGRANPNLPGREWFQRYLHSWETLGAEHR